MILKPSCFTVRRFFFVILQINKRIEVEENIIYSKDVLEFVTVAAEYCAFVETVEQIDKKNFFNKSQKLLSVLYLKTSILLKFEAIYEDGNEKFVSEEDWTFLKNKIAQKIGQHEVFIDVNSTAISQEDDTVSVSLSEIFADIYQDLMDFLTLYRIGHEESMNDALWECQQNFEQYWGSRLLAALSAIHNIIYSGDDLSDEANKEIEQAPKERNTDDWIFTQRQKEWGKDDE